MISSIVFVNAKGEILIYRTYKDGITRSDLHNFCTQVVARKENKEVPIVNIDGANFIHITTKDVILVATTDSNVNTVMVLQFLYTMINLYKCYFGGEFNEDQVRKHFVLIYELLDEVMDFGIPQILEPDLLKQFIMEGGMKLKPNQLSSLATIQPTGQLTGPTGWRAPNIYYNKNEVYLDVIENVNATLSNKGTILKADVHGQIKIRSKLSGMPECKFGLNDRVLMEKESRKVSGDKGINIDDFKFHQCVKLGQFDKQRAITFIPPDGEFELMSYRVTENVNLPFKIMPIVDEVGKNRIEFTIKLKALFEKNLFGTHIVLKVPCPKHTAIANTSASVGKAKYEPENGGIFWRIKKFQGETETLLRCSIQLLENGEKQGWLKPPISLNFQVPMFTASGLRVRYLRISEQSGYQATKWILYTTKGGEYYHRL